MTYAGLTTADKGALLDAKAKGWDHVRVREDGSFEKYMNGVFLCAITVYNIDLALAQIAEMEKNQVLSEIIDSIENKPPLTWNERINQMTVEEKAWSLVDGELSRVIERAIDFSYDNSDGTEYDQQLIQKTFIADFLHSPYTKGVTDEG